jgi:glutamate synthase (NADPH) small chain
MPIRKERLKHYKRIRHPQPDEGTLKAQASRCMNCGIPYCHNGCPVNNMIPDWNHLVYEGTGSDALETSIRPTISPNSPAASAPPRARRLHAEHHRPAGDHQVDRMRDRRRGWKEGWITPQVPEKRPASRSPWSAPARPGLACAQQLARAGHSVTVFEKSDRIGGLLRYGIPDFKMEKHLINRRAVQMEAEGVTFKPRPKSASTSRSSSLQGKLRRGRAAGGAEEPRQLEIPGAELPGVRLAMEFLTQQNKRNAGDDELRAAPRGSLLATGKHVVVLGGGDTGSTVSAPRTGRARPRHPDRDHAQAARERKTRR